MRWLSYHSEEPWVGLCSAATGGVLAPHPPHPFPPHGVARIDGGAEERVAAAAGTWRGT